MKYSWVAVLLILGASLASAQTTPKPVPPSQDDTQSSSEDQTEAAKPAPDSDNSTDPVANARSKVPTPMSIGSSALQFSGDQGHSNYLRGGIGVGASYDTNLLSQEQNKVGGLTYSILPNIGIDMTRRRLVLKLNYSGGYTINQRFSSYNQTAHAAEADLSYRLSPHVTLRVYDRFGYSAGFFNQLDNSTGLGGGGVQQPNPGIVTPLAPHTDDLGSVELTYQYSAGDMVGFSGTFHNSSFGTPPAGSTALVDTQSEGATAYYTHRFTPRNWSGISYNFQRFSFNPSIQQVDTHSFQLFHTIYLRRNMQLAFFGGPDYTEVDSQIVTTTLALPFVTVTTTPVSNTRLSGGGGINFSWEGKSTSIRASAVRKVSDGGGLLAAVENTNGNGALRRRLGRNSTVEFGGLYGETRSIGGASVTTYDHLKTASGSVSLEQRFGRNFLTVLGFAHDYQQQAGEEVPTLNVHHNRGWITIGYQFNRPLGR